LKLAEGPICGWHSRAAFCAEAIKAIRRILLDHARTKKRLKRGGPDARRLELDTSLLGMDTPLDYCELHELLEQLNELDERSARIVELRFFCGLRDDEIAESLHCSRHAVARDWRYARAWLLARLGGSLEGGGHTAE
jgi:RNA polymerase sigma factor (TIGR02999 family)